MKKMTHILKSILAAGCLCAASSCDKPATALPIPETEQTPAQSPAAAREKTILRSRLIGRWYPRASYDLSVEIDGFLKNVPDTPREPVMALIMPHAGYRYSGQIAAHAARQIQDKAYRRVIVIGPSHSQPMKNFCSVPDVTHYETPLGQVPLDVELIEKLRARGDFFQCIPEAHVWEHSVQVQVPFLQHMLKDFTLVPILTGHLDEKTTRAIADILKQEMDNETLLVISSDFTHYGASYGFIPFTTDIPANIEKLDMSVFDPIRRKDLSGLYRQLDVSRATVCGRCPLGILLAMLPRDAKIHLLKYDTSGRITGDWSASVSYLAAAVTGLWAPDRPPAPKQNTVVRPAPAAKPELNPEDKEKLLRLARISIEFWLTNRSKPSPNEVWNELTPGMQQTLGAFVTLKKNGALRGCIGEIIPHREVYKAVIEHAINAAAFDRRFAPLRKEELDAVEIEISALLPPRAVDSYRDIEIGRHGIVLKKGGRQAVFLPQVAAEQGWTLEETLSQLAMKAGLPPDGWKQNAEFMVFEAIVFHEGDE